MQSKNELYNILVNEYVKYFYNFSLSRTTSINDAEDLSQMILFECVKAINKNEDIKNIDKYFWSIAHNTYKRYLKSKNEPIVYDSEYCMKIYDNNSVDTTSTSEEMTKIRYSLLVLSGMYRKVIVDYYYENLKIKDISKKYNQSEEMIKWYLQKSKKKIKEIYQMKDTFGIKSFNPSNFSIYYSGIDFSRVNVWSLFKRLLPKQIVLSCYNKSKTITELSIELGVASCYLEEEIEILVKSGVLLNNGGNKFSTNFLIINKEEQKTIEKLYEELYKNYIKIVDDKFNENLSKIKETKMFKYDVPIERYKWIFGDKVANFDYRLLYIKDEEYPRILSCGARAFIFGEESSGSIYCVGQTPSRIDKYTLWARDSQALSKTCKNQEIFKNHHYTKIVTDVYNGIISDELKEDYAYLIKEGYLVNINNKIYANVAYLSKEFNQIMERINEELSLVLENGSKKICTYLEKMIKRSLPKNLKEYAHGYMVTLVNFYSGIYFMKNQMESGFNKLAQTKEDGLVLNYFIEN
ncbi:MAG: sigma-70 family RNA polymerase sigma factor [Bacilli bacterium]|nr:sigma-70 family RNA polymerase sigma factor [Bacilli bacterium]